MMPPCWGGPFIAGSIYLEVSGSMEEVGWGGVGVAGWEQGKRLVQWC